MANEHFPSWQFQSFYHAAEATWGTSVTTNFWKVRENTKAYAYKPPPIQRPRGTGSGHHLPDANDSVQAASPGFEMATTWWGTQMCIRDAVMLMFQGNATDEVDYFRVTLPSDAEVHCHATLAQRSSTRDDAYRWRQTSCLLKSLAIHSPQVAPGEHGFATLDLGWIGAYTKQQVADFTTTVGAGQTDTGAPYDAADRTYQLGAYGSEVTYPILSWNLNIGNGAHLKEVSPSALVDGTMAEGALLGEWALTGDVTVYDQGETTSSPLAVIHDSIENGTVLYQLFTLSGATGLVAGLPIVFHEPPNRGDVKGIGSLTFPFEVIYTTTANYTPRFDVLGTLDTPPYLRA